MSYRILLVAFLAFAALGLHTAARPSSARAGSKCALGGPSVRVHGCFRPHPRPATSSRGIVIGATPATPIPVDAPVGPPPIPALMPAAATAPPADAIADPLRTGARCADWRLRSSYGDRWPAGSTWWEYTCTFDPTDSYAVGRVSIDYFYWDGWHPVFYGESCSSAWWDASSSAWYGSSPDPLFRNASGS